MGVVPDPHQQWSGSFPPGTDAAVEARTWLQSILDAWPVGVDQADALLLLTELVTNAVRYSRSHVLQVDVEVAGDTLVVGVSDDEPSAPTTLTPGPDDVGGRGLVLVDRLSADWGVSPRPGGKRVWFNLKRTGPG